MKAKMQSLLVRYGTSRNVRASLIIVSILLMALAGGAPDAMLGGAG